MSILFWLIHVSVLCLYFILFYYIRTKQWYGIDNRLFNRRLFYFSFIIRTCGAIIVYILMNEIYGTPFHPGGDALMYHNYAWEIARDWRNGVNSNPSQLLGYNYGYWGYFYLVATLYYFSGPYDIIARAINCLLGALTCIFVYWIAREDFPESTARFAGLATAIFPLHVFYSVVVLKDIIICFLIALSIYLGRLLVKQVKISVFFTFVLITAVMIFFRSELAFVSMAALGMAFIFKKTHRWDFMILYGLVICIAFYYSDLIQTFSHEYFSYEARERAVERIITLRSLPVSSGSISAGLLMASSLLMPLPTVVKIETFYGLSFTLVVASCVFIWNLVIPGIFLGILKTVKLLKSQSVLLVTYFIMMLMGMNLFPDKVLSYRWKIIFVPLAMIFFAAGFPIWVKKHRMRFMFWIILIILIISYNIMRRAGHPL